jgi:glutamate formiminotransferase/formiminotetrahydrofolate cyclodeaminase
LRGLVKESFESFLERIAASTPTPGGGSASAICGALSAALSRMVANLAVGKPGYEHTQADLSQVDTRGIELQGRFLALASEDADAYDAVVAAMRLPKASDDERAARREAMQSAYQRAAQVPMETIGAALEALEIAALAAERGNRSAITDAGVAALLAEAAMRGAALNVRVNLAAIADEGWRERTERELGFLLEAGTKRANAIEALVESRM